MKKWLALVVFISSLATAAMEFRATAIRGFNLYKGPNENFGVTGEMVKPGEELYVIGASVGGGWIRVANVDGATGWIPGEQVKLERVADSDVYEVQQNLERVGRFKSLLQVDTGLSSGSMPFGKGISISATLNFAPSGILGVNRDQVEFGGEFSYYLGREVFGYIKNDSTKYGLNEGSALSFLSYSLFGQWLFRSGNRGAFMMGPRGGFMITRFNYGDQYHFPLLLGMVMRYFTDENFGYSASATATIDTSVYFFYSFGVAFRF